VVAREGAAVPKAIKVVATPADRCFHKEVVIEPAHPQE
jgi:hypothetical protein